MVEDITFCVHCRNRLRHLRKTLPANIEVISRYTDVGLTIVNYNSEDGLDAWARSSLQDSIARGKVTYAREFRSKTFHASKAKNLAHKLAKGRFVINLDADNFIGATIPRLKSLIRSWPRAVIRVWGGRLHDRDFRSHRNIQERLYKTRRLR